MERLSKTYGIGELGSNVGANGDFILKKSLVGDIWGELRDMTAWMMGWLISDALIIVSVEWLYHSTSNSSSLTPLLINNCILLLIALFSSLLCFKKVITYTDHQPRYLAPSRQASKTLRRDLSSSRLQPCRAALRRPSSPPQCWHRRFGTRAGSAKAAMRAAVAAVAWRQIKRERRK